MQKFICRRMILYVVILFLLGFGISFSSWGKAQMIQFEEYRLNQLQEKKVDLENILVEQKNSLTSSLKKTYMQDASVTQTARILNQMQNTKESLKNLTDKRNKIIAYLSNNGVNY